MTLFELVHFNRPIWLLLVPILWLSYLLLGFKPKSSQLKHKVASHLIPFIVETPSSKRYFHWLGLVSASFFVIGIAGISFQKTETELYVAQQKTVFIFDQSLSMYATDIRPNRLTRAKQIVRDILNADLEGDVALVAFAGDAYTISPFTQDKQTLTHFLVALEPIIMPLYGSNLKSAIEQSQTLIRSATPSSVNHFIILTDDINDADRMALQRASEQGIKIDLIGIGTEEGGTMLLPDGQRLKKDGIDAIATAPLSKIKNASQYSNSHFYLHTLERSEIENIVKSTAPSNAERSQISGQTWQDQGHLFAVPFLIWLLLQFRQGWFIGLFIFALQHPATSHASPLDWFKTPDQNGQTAFNKGQWETAANYFQQPQWKAASLYAGQRYEDSAKALENIASSASDYYNLGNALALSQKLDAAITAYTKALTLKPNFNEAQQNLDYVKKVKQQSENNKAQDNSRQPDSNNSQKQEPPSEAQNRTNQEHTNKNKQKQDNSIQKQDNKTSTQASDTNQDIANEQTQKEQQQALNQWLRQIQDDPGNLLKRKLWYLHQERRHENRFNQEEGQQPW
ncbi:vWA domain-containing protein [Marinomonas ostreistagni]|uniref:VWA domain-containing protein n=1 Tax=Marinomonas ostreistagni TaxID=359209 RepID=A0ABS0ZA05_9GAMM|nr:VWA domain-containing protein [Marinomonas ostreistagni]MBJ7550477.1 VWA domain-containing protein [Marinomonas ostreistagni]